MDDQGLWDDDDGIFYDQLITARRHRRCRSRSSRWPAMIPPLAVGIVRATGARERAPCSASGSPAVLDGRRLGRRPVRAADGRMRGEPGQRRLLLSLSSPDQLERHAWPRLFDEAEFLSPYGLRSLSACAPGPSVRDHFDGHHAPPSTTSLPSRRRRMFGGNSNWRGPVWFPLNYLFICALERYHQFFGDGLRAVEYPTGSGEKLTLDVIAADLRAGSSRSSPGAPTGGGPASAGSNGCSMTPSGGTTWSSTSTSTATTAPGSARRTRPAGPA